MRRRMVAMLLVLTLVFGLGVTAQGSYHEMEDPPSITILSPTEGATLQGDVMVALKVENFNIVNKIGQAAVAGEGHIHLYLDGKLVGPTADLERTLTGLGPGTHTLKADLHDNDHTPIGQEASVQFVANTLSVKVPALVPVGQAVDVAFAVENFILAPDKIAQAAVAGEGHVHVYLNGRLLGPVAVSPRRIEGLEPGTYTVRVAVHHNDHTPLGVLREVSFSVVEPVARSEARITVLGQPVVLEVPPVVVEGRTYLPFRAIFEALGATVDYEAETRTVMAVLGGKEIRLQIGSTMALVAGMSADMGGAPFIMDGRTVVPLRFVAEATGFMVDWQPTWEIRIEHH